MKPLAFQCDWRSVIHVPLKRIWEAGQEWQKYWKCWKCQPSKCHFIVLCKYGDTVSACVGQSVTGVFLRMSLFPLSCLWSIPRSRDSRKNNQSNVIFIHLSLGTKVIPGHCPFSQDSVWVTITCYSQPESYGDLFSTEKNSPRDCISFLQCRAERVALNHALRTDIPSGIWVCLARKTSRAPLYCFCLLLLLLLSLLLLFC